MAITQSTINGISAAFAQPNGSIAISSLATDFSGNQTTALGFAANMAALADAGASLVAKANPITAGAAFGLGAAANLQLASKQLSAPNGVSAGTALEAAANLVGVAGSIALGFSGSAAAVAFIGISAPALATIGVATLAAALGATIAAKAIDPNLSVDQAISDIQQGISDMASAFGDAFSDAVSAFSDGLQSLASGDWFNDMMDALGPSILNGAFAFGDFLNGIGDAVSDAFNAARNWIPRCEPLVLDLDGDGIETIGANGTVLFDHDGDGTRHSTGWTKADDGIVVLDRNGNGTIDNGGELFGVETVLSNGTKAADGFTALADLDTNQDGVFDAGDARYAHVRIWRDLNQNGRSEAGELKSLSESGIAGISLAVEKSNTTLSNGNRIIATGTYTRLDGTEHAAADLDFATGRFWREFPDTIPLTDAARSLVDIRGSGAVRDLREAGNDGMWERAA